MAKRETTAISLVGDDIYVQALAALARERGQRIGDLVREALDAHYGETLVATRRIVAEQAEKIKSMVSASDAERTA